MLYSKARWYAIIRKVFYWLRCLIAENTQPTLNRKGLLKIIRLHMEFLDMSWKQSWMLCSQENCPAILQNCLVISYDICLTYFT